MKIYKISVLRTIHLSLACYCHFIPWVNWEKFNTVIYDYMISTVRTPFYWFKVTQHSKYNKNARKAHFLKSAFLSLSPSIYKLGLGVWVFVWVSVCLYPINVKTSEAIGPKFSWDLVDPREGLWMIKFSNICLHQNSIFENFENPRIFFWKSAKFFVFVIC